MQTVDDLNSFAYHQNVPAGRQPEGDRSLLPDRKCHREPDRSPALTLPTARRPDAPVPAAEKVQRVIYAIAILFPVVAFGIFRALAPPIKDSAAAQLAWWAAHPGVHQAEAVIFPLACVLSLLGIIGLARLAIGRSPWLTLTGGALALAGWAPCRSGPARTT